MGIDPVVLNFPLISTLLVGYNKSIICNNSKKSAKETMHFWCTETYLARPETTIAKRIYAWIRNWEKS